MSSLCSEPPSLLSLPQELRLQIWSRAFSGISVQLSRHHRDKKPLLWRTRYGDQVCLYRREDLNILLLCRSIWKEARQCIQNAQLSECQRGSGLSLTNYHVCDLVLHEVEHLKIKRLVTTCSRPECIRAIIQHQPCPGLKVIEWYKPGFPYMAGYPSFKDFLPNNVANPIYCKYENLLEDGPTGERYRWVGNMYKVFSSSERHPLCLSIRPPHEMVSDWSGVRLGHWTTGPGDHVPKPCECE